MYRNEYFECICGSLEHMLVVNCCDFDPENRISICTQFYPHINVFKRIWISLKYIFNPYSDNYPWGDTIIRREDLDRFIKILQEGKE